MSQSAFIVGALLGGFVLFLAVKGRLASYEAVLWGPKPSTSGSGSGSAGSSGGSSTGSTVKTALEVAQFAAMA